MNLTTTLQSEMDSVFTEQPGLLDGISSVLVITGVSGAGRSTALRIVGDLGYYAVSNLPTGLFPAFLRLEGLQGLRYKHLALIFGTNSESKVEELLVILDVMHKRGFAVNAVFLDSCGQVLLQRYTETRRPHPVYDPLVDRGLADTIERERLILEPLRKVANLVIDTSIFTVHDLKRTLSDYVHSLQNYPKSKVFVVMQSFGFKYGLPTICDFLLDIRFLTNPYFKSDLKHLTGLDKGVFDFVMSNPEAIELERLVLNMFEFLLPRYLREGKSHLSICIGCTGGKHRSVSLVESLARKIRLDSIGITTTHRDIER
jgi:RNase adapter protein RapZ